MQKSWAFAVKSKQIHSTLLCHLFNDSVVYLLILSDSTILHLEVNPIATFAHAQKDIHMRHLAGPVGSACDS